MVWKCLFEERLPKQGTELFFINQESIPKNKIQNLILIGNFNQTPNLETLNLVFPEWKLARRSSPQ